MERDEVSEKRYMWDVRWVYSGEERRCWKMYIVVICVRLG